jgi:hypothetical protein
LPFFRAYLQFFGREQKLRLLVVSDSSGPFALLPLVVRREQYRTGTLRRLTYPLDDWSSFYGPIGTQIDDAIAAAIEHIGGTPRDWDVIDLRAAAAIGQGEGDAHANTAATTEGAFEKSRMIFRKHVQKRTAVIETLGDWDDYLQTRDRSFQTDLRQAFRSVSQLGRVEFLRVRPAGQADGDDDPHWALYDDCVSPVMESSQEMPVDGVTQSNSLVREFLRKCHRLAARMGMLDMNVLRVDGQTVAYAYNFHHRGHVHILRSGFHPQFGKAGVGTVLWERVFEDGLDRGDRLYDLGPDSLPIKRPWWTRVVPVWEFAHYAKTPPAQLARLSDWWKDRRNPQPETAQLVGTAS